MRNTNTPRTVTRLFKARMKPEKISTDSKLEVRINRIAKDDCTAIAIDGTPSLLVRASKRSCLMSSPITCKTRGPATVIALTNPDSDIAREASLLFPCQLIEDTSVYTTMSSRLAQLALLDAIHVALALAQGESASENLRRSKDALNVNFSQ